MVTLVDLDPQTVEPRLEANEDLRQVPLLDEEHNTYVGTTIAATEAELVHQALKRNVNLFVLIAFDMLGLSPNIITHNLQGGASGSLEKAQAKGGEEVGSEGRGRETPVSQVYTRGSVHHFVGQYSHGHQFLEQMVDVCGLHECRQGMPKGFVPAS